MSGCGKKNNLSALESYINEKKKSGGVEVEVWKHSDSKDGHPHLIVEKFPSQKVCVSVGLTSSPSKGKGSTNYTLSYSPFPDGKNKSYVRRQATVDSYNNYSCYRYPKGVVSGKDYERIVSYGEKAKQNPKNNSRYNFL